ncbi:MAG: hypothetical protein ACE5EH_08825, partial [Gammaproteobacteria bacterium]
MTKRIQFSKTSLILFFGLLNLCFSAQANLVNDPSIEAGTKWNPGGGDVGFTTQAAQVRTGSKAVKVVNNGNGTNSPTSKMIQERIPGVTAGTEYIFSVWVKGNGVIGTVGGAWPIAAIKWRDASGAVIRELDNKLKESYMWAPGGIEAKNNPKTYPYQKMFIHLQAPSGAKSFDVDFRTWYGCTGGETYWDDVSLVARDLSILGTKLATYQAENATITGGHVASDHSDYTGSGFVDIDGAQGFATFEWTNVDGGAGGARILNFRYSWEGNEQPIELFVNGVSQGARKPEAGTGRRGVWASDIWTVNLRAGNNTIKYKVNRKGGLKSQPMVDKLDVHSTTGGGGGGGGGGGVTAPASPP